MADKTNGDKIEPSSGNNGLLGTNANKNNANQQNAIEILKKKLFIDPLSKISKLKLIRETGNFNIAKQIPPVYIILPNSSYKKMWDTFIFIVIFYSIIIIPLDIGWNLDCFTYNNAQNFKSLYLASTIIFFFDMSLCFITAVLDDKNNYIYDIELIITCYLKGWFIIDLISALPFDRIITFNMSDCFQATLPMSKVFMILSLFRFIKLGKILAMIEREFSRYALPIRFSKLFLFILYFAHLFGNLFVSKSPTFKSNIFAQCYSTQIVNSIPFNLCIKQFLQNNFLTLYFFSVYWGIVASLGNDVIVQQNWEMFFLLMVTVVSTIVNASIYGNAAVMLNSVSFGVSPILREKLDVMKEYMGFMNFDGRFIDQIEEYHVNIWLKQRNMMYEDNFLNDMSLALQRILLLEQWKSSFFLSSKFFPLVSENFILDMVPVFKPKIFMNNDVIITEGDSEKDVFFIPKTGICQVKIGGIYVSQMKDGEYFGEISVFLRSNRRTATVVCLKDSDFLFCEGGDFEKLLKDFPNDYNMIRKQAISRLLESMKLYPSGLFAKLVPNNNIKDYMFRKCIYLDNEEEDILFENKKKKNLIDGSLFNNKMENVAGNIRGVKEELEKIMKKLSE